MARNEKTPQSRRRKIIKKKKQGRPPRTKLNAQEEVAVSRYFANNFNKTEALKHAGMKSGNDYCTRFFARPLIANEVEKRLRAITRKSNITAEMVLEEYRKIGMSNFGDLITVQDDGTAFLDLTELSDDQRAAMSEFTVEEYWEGKGDDAVPVKKFKVKFHSKLEALGKLGNYFEMFKDKVEHSGTVDVAERLMAGRKRMNREKQEDAR